MTSPVWPDPLSPLNIDVDVAFIGCRCWKCRDLSKSMEIPNQFFTLGIFSKLVNLLVTCLSYILNSHYSIRSTVITYRYFSKKKYFVAYLFDKGPWPNFITPFFITSTNHFDFLLRLLFVNFFTWRKVRMCARMGHVRKCSIYSKPPYFALPQHLGVI